MFFIKKKDVQADVTLLLITMLWGSSFSILKDVLNEASTANVLFLRFFIATLLMLPFAFFKRNSFSKDVFNKGIICGVILFIAFVAQFIGINYTSASRSGFITGTCVVIVPILSIFILRKVPAINALIGAAIVFVGLYIFTMADTTQETTFNNGDLITLICALFYAFHIIALGKYSDGDNAFWLTFVQIALICIGGLIWTLYSGDISFEFTPVTWGKIFFLSSFCTVIAYGVQIWAQGFTSPTRAAIIFSLEPVSAAIIAWWWLDEKIGLWGVLGGAMIVSGIVIAEIKRADWRAVKNDPDDFDLQITGSE